MHLVGFYYKNTFSYPVIVVDIDKIPL